LKERLHDEYKGRRKVSRAKCDVLTEVTLKIPASRRALRICSYLLYGGFLKPRMELMCYPETSINFHWTVRRYITENAVMLYMSVVNKHKDRSRDQINGSKEEKCKDRAISLYCSKTVDKKEILRTVSGIYCSSDKVGTVYLI
jgi:hypothetical protein